jgi:signal transduction histidine kinase
MGTPEQRLERAASHALGGFVRAVPLPAFVVGLDDMILAANVPAEDLLGTVGAGGRLRFKDVPLSFRATGLRAAIEEVKRGGVGVRLDEQFVTTSEGQAVLVLQVAPLTMGDGPVGVVVTAESRQEQRALQAQLDLVNAELRSTTEQMETVNEELRAAIEELQAVNLELSTQLEELRSAREAIRHKDEFLAMLAHELRNPLAPILTAIEVLRARSADPAAVRQAMEIVERQVRHQARLLDDLLDVSRITRGVIDLHRRPVDLAEVVSRAVETATAVVDGRRRRLSITQAPEPLPLDADPVRLAQVISNLLTNAAKFTPPGGRLGLRTERDGATALLRVTDTGAGIPPEMLDRVFDMFTQVDSSLARSQGGLGIGLTLVKTLVELHGGTVAAHSPGPGRGSEFVVRLPLSATPGPLVRSGERPRRRRRQVLIVEDNADAREVLSELLRLDGHEVLLAEDGLRGIEMALLHRPEVVLIDIGLPGVSGYDVAADPNGARARCQAGRAHRVRPAGGSPAQSRSRLRRPSHQAGRPRGPRRGARLTS